MCRVSYPSTQGIADNGDFGEGAAVFLRFGAMVAMACGTYSLALPAFAGHVSETLAVSARVSPSASVGFEISAQALEITAADLDRGYVDVVMKSRMHVTTAKGRQAQPAVVMGIEPRTDLFKGMTVDSGGNGHSGNGHSTNGNGHSALEAGMPATAGVAEVEAGQVREFRYRFEFAKSTREGHYGTAISVAIDL
jgi:hypothetical protein